MNDTLLISIVTFIYFFAAFVFLISVMFHKRSVGKWGLILIAAGAALQTSAIIIRWIHSYQLGIGHAPLSNFYESLVFFSWSIIFRLFDISLCFPVRRCKLHDSTAHPCPSKQLADKSCDQRFSRLCLFCHRVWDEHPVSVEDQVQSKHTARCTFLGRSNVQNDINRLCAVDSGYYYRGCVG